VSVRRSPISFAGRKLRQRICPFAKRIFKHRVVLLAHIEKMLSLLHKIIEAWSLTARNIDLSSTSVKASARFKGSTGLGSRDIIRPFLNK
jgi:hypothetical protein